MKAASDIRTGYVIRERALRAQYADTVGMTITHPFELDDRVPAEDMHGRIVDLVDPSPATSTTLRPRGLQVGRPA